MHSHCNKALYKGLLARWHEKLCENDKSDIICYKKMLSNTSGKILQLGCGTGHLLVPLRQLGLDIEGLDSSDEMLAICLNKLENSKITKTALYEQDMTDFEINKQYDIIFISSGSFQFIIDFDVALHCLKNIYNHLKTNGKFIVELLFMWDHISRNQDRLWVLTEEAENEAGERFLCYECAWFDIENQIKKSIFKFELYRNNKLVETEISNFYLRWYGKNEFKLILEKTGFSKIDMQAENDNALIYSAH